MINVYLDDHRPCPKGFVLAKNIEECILLLEQNEINILSLDHDLGWGEPTGTELVNYMIKHKLFANEIFLHTSDPLGKMRMFQNLNENRPPEVVVHNNPMPQEVLNNIMKEVDHD